MLRHPGLIAVCACIAASVGCDGGNQIAPTLQTSPLLPTYAVEFGGRVVNADTGGPVGNVRVSVDGVRFEAPGPRGWVDPKATATSGGDGTFAFVLNLQTGWRSVSVKLTGPAGYDERGGRIDPTAAPCDLIPCWAAADRPTIRMYPTLVIRPGESIDVRVDRDISVCGGFFAEAADCRRVLLAASPGDPVELEVVPDDSSKPMALSLEGSFVGRDDLIDWSVRRLMVPPGGVPYVLGAGTARLTARR